MKRYAAGDEMAFSTLYEKYYSQVYAYIHKRMRPSEVDDLFQKVWRHLHEKRHLYLDQPFAPWFFVLIRHLLIDEYRSLGRRKNQVFHDTLADQGEANDPIDIEELLAVLPEDQGNLVRKYYIEGLSYEDLEKQTGLSQVSLRQRLSRGLRKIKSSFKD